MENQQVMRSILTGKFSILNNRVETPPIQNNRPATQLMQEVTEQSHVERNHILCHSAPPKVIHVPTGKAIHVRRNLAGNKPSIVTLNQTGSKPTPISTLNQTESKPTPKGTLNQKESKSTSIMTPNQTGSKQTSISTLNQTGSKPTSIVTLNQTGSKPTSIVKLNQTGSKPVSIVNLNQTESKQTSIWTLNQTGSKPTSIVKLNQTGSKPTSIVKLNQTGSKPTSIVKLNQTGSKPTSIVELIQTGNKPTSIVKLNQTGSKPTSTSILNKIRSKLTPIVTFDQVGSKQTPISNLNQEESKSTSIMTPNQTGSKQTSISTFNQTGSKPTSIVKLNQTGSKPTSIVKLNQTGSKPTSIVTPPSSNNGRNSHGDCITAQSEKREFEVPGFHGRLSTQLYELQQTGEMCDAVLVTNNGNIRVHKLVLMASRSPLLMTNILYAEKNGGKKCVFRIHADIGDVTLLVRSLYTGKIELCAKSVEKIIALCYMLQMEEEMKFYVEMAKKFHEEESSEPEKKVKAVTPIYCVEKAKDGIIVNYLGGNIDVEDAIENSSECLGADVERRQIVGGTMEPAYSDKKGGDFVTQGQEVIMVNVDEIKEEPDENRLEEQTGTHLLADQAAITTDGQDMFNNDARTTVGHDLACGITSTTEGQDMILDEARATKEQEIFCDERSSTDRQDMISHETSAKEGQDMYDVTIAKEGPDMFLLSWPPCTVKEQGVVHDEAGTTYNMYNKGILHVEASTAYKQGHDDASTIDKDGVVHDEASTLALPDIVSDNKEGSTQTNQPMQSYESSQDTLKKSLSANLKTQNIGKKKNDRRSKSCVNVYGKDAFVFSSKWTEEDVERLMEIYWEMKARSDKIDWAHVSNKLYNGHTKDHCRYKVKALLRLNGEKYMKKVAHSPSVSTVTSQPSTVTSQPSTVTSQPSTLTSQLSSAAEQTCIGLATAAVSSTDVHNLVPAQVSIKQEQDMDQDATSNTKQKASIPVKQNVSQDALDTTEQITVQDGPITIDTHSRMKSTGDTHTQESEEGSDSGLPKAVAESTDMERNKGKKKNGKQSKNTKRGSSPYSRSEKWPQKVVERLMTIYWEMKARSDKNDWVYVSKKLGIRKYTHMDCAKKVKRLLRKNGENYMKKAPNIPLPSSGTSQPSCASEETHDGQRHDMGFENTELVSTSTKKETADCHKKTECNGNVNDMGVINSDMIDSTECSLIMEYECVAAKIDENQEDIESNNNFDDKDEDDPYRLQMGIRVTESGAYRCDVCFVQFPSFRDVMLHHSFWHTSKKHFPCIECGKVFTSKDTWCNHNIKEHDKFRKSTAKYGLQMGLDITESGTYKCDVCLDTFPSYVEVRKHHTSEHTAKKHFPCPECDKVYTDKRFWRNHNKKIHRKFGIRSKRKKKSAARPTLGIGVTDSGSYKCDVCLKDFPTHKEVMQHHKSEHTSKKHFPCLECSQVFSTKAGWFYHNKRVHYKVSMIKRSRKVFLCDPNSGLYQCDICLVKFPSFKEVRHHHHSEHTTKRHFPCLDCGKVSTSNISWHFHNVRKHKKFTTETQTCKWCGDVYPTIKRYYEAHIEKCQKIYIFNCEKCGKFFKKQAALDKHNRTEHYSDVLAKRTCSTCGAVFVSENAREKHEECHKDPNNQCNECHKWFLSPEACERHKKSHNPNASTKCMLKTEKELNKCQVYEKGFTSQSKLDDHVKGHFTYEATLYKCEVCNRRFSSKVMLGVHLKRHFPSAETPYKCETCEKKFVSKAMLSIHLKQHLPSDEKVHQCPICDRRFPLKAVLNIHMKQHLPNTKMLHKCFSCNKRFVSKTMLNVHIKKQHIPSKENPYKCRPCGKAYATKVELNVHLKQRRPRDIRKPNHFQICNEIPAETNNLNKMKKKSHRKPELDEKSRCCKYCGVVMKTKKHLDAHILQKHSGEKPLYCCEHCERTFLTSQQLTRHIYHKHKQLEKMCETCGKVCENMTKLQQHISSSHKELLDTIECNECKKVFHSRKGYRNHCVTTHLKYEDIDKFPIKVHACPTCHKLFTCKHKLEWHVRTHTGDKPEICHICGKRFSYKGNLESHIKIHTDDKPFVCDTCGKRFIHRKELRKHVESHSKGTIPKKKTALKEPISESDNTDDEYEETEDSDMEEYSSESEISDLEESSSELQVMDNEYGDTEAAVMNILSSKANDNVVYEGEYQDTEVAILEDGSSSNLLYTNVDEGGSQEEFSNETVTCDYKIMDIEEDMPIELEENNTALQLLLWDSLVVDDGDVNMPSLELQ